MRLPGWAARLLGRSELDRLVESHRRYIEDPETRKRLDNIPPAGFISRSTGEIVGFRREFLDGDRVRVSEDAARWPGEEATVCGYFPWSPNGTAGTFRRRPYMVYVWGADGYVQYAETDLEKLE
ncbi:hypothetical protein SCMU_14230 [Sinomonas cyclohexanicum]|uniref:Uncharacterized protein n=1 Tax=Sinomonas cyclohexanicum TaxID=322009 RepID=A0ABN6FFY6_SINCY|nr:hypothetical protein [Corynebacterium cyclohexanicum]BCT75581.1 hypothetical protein SCMU_14230 [Corynebacterium cyclohexanicum]